MKKGLKILTIGLTLICFCGCEKKQEQVKKEEVYKNKIEANVTYVYETTYELKENAKQLIYAVIPKKDNEIYQEIRYFYFSENGDSFISSDTEYVLNDKDKIQSFAIGIKEQTNADDVKIIDNSVFEYNVKYDNMDKYTLKEYINYLTSKNKYETIEIRYSKDEIEKVRNN